LSLAQFAQQANQAIDTSLREIIIEVGNSVIRMSPVGNPEIWAANVAHREQNTRAADDYDFKVAVRNTVINLDDSNFTRSGKLRKGVKYAKPLTKAERVQNFNVNGLVSGRGYVGGRFRGNWMFSIGSPANTTTDQVDPTGRNALARITDGALEFRRERRPTSPTHCPMPSLWNTVTQPRRRAAWCASPSRAFSRSYWRPSGTISYESQNHPLAVRATPHGVGRGA
jgi:hypothetical protein